MMSRVALPNSGVPYKFGFNGKWNDNEVKGLGNQQDYGMRIYDPRLGRFLSVDPLTKEYPWYTPYQFAGNKPIKFIDRDGAEEEEESKSIWDILWDALFAKDKMEEGATKVMEGAGQNAEARSRQGSY
jgi:RHS repeat-associated protein